MKHADVISTICSKCGGLALVEARTEYRNGRAQRVIRRRCVEGSLCCHVEVAAVEEVIAP